jgi:hypothetical protein
MEKNIVGDYHRPGYTENIRELETVQRRAARFVTGDYRTTSSVTQMDVKP